MPGQKPVFATSRNPAASPAGGSVSRAATSSDSKGGPPARLRAIRLAPSSSSVAAPPAIAPTGTAGIDHFTERAWTSRTTSSMRRMVRTCRYQIQPESSSTSKWSGRPSGPTTARNVCASVPAVQRSFQKKKRSTRSDWKRRPTFRYQFHSSSGDQPRMPWLTTCAPEERARSVAWSCGPRVSSHRSWRASMKLSPSNRRLTLPVGISGPLMPMELISTLAGGNSSRGLGLLTNADRGGVRLLNRRATSSESLSRAVSPMPSPRAPASSAARASTVEAAAASALARARGGPAGRDGEQDRARRRQPGGEDDGHGGEAEDRALQPERHRDSGDPRERGAEPRVAVSPARAPAPDQEPGGQHPASGQARRPRPLRPPQGHVRDRDGKGEPGHPRDEQTEARTARHRRPGGCNP